MDKDKAIYYVENSFLTSLLKDEDITDITFNGVDIYYASNRFGRAKSNIVVDHQTVKDFLRQIANLTESQFSYTSPNLDTTIGKYRIHATHQSIGKMNNEDVVTFAIRIASTKPRITDSSDFFTPEIIQLVNAIVKRRLSIVIGGITGTGKTEFQKYIIRNFPKNERVIIVDNVLELDSVRNEADIDLTCWKIDEKNPNVTSSSLIKNALRNNPDWLILAEARDKEMVDVLNSAMTGIPLITTVHAFDVCSLPYRMGRMVLKSDQKLDYDETLKDIYYHFHFYFYLVKEERNGEVVRYISDVGYIDNDGCFYYLYRKINDSHHYYKMPKSCIDLLKIKETSSAFKQAFILGGVHE